MLAEAKKNVLDDESNSINIDGATRRALTIVLTMMYGEGWDRSVNPATTSPSLNPSIPPPPSELSDELSNAHSPVENNADYEEDEIENNVLILTSGEALDMEEIVKSQIMGEIMIDGVVNHYLEKIGIKPVKDKRKNAEKLKKWLDIEPRKRPFALMTKGKLIDECINKFGGKKSAYESSSNEDLICRLSTYQNDPRYIALQNNRAQTRGSSSICTSLLRQIVKSSFLPKLSAKGKEYCKMGQNLEVPFARKLLQHSKEGLTKYKIEKIFRVGLVAKRNKNYAKASCDFVAADTIEEETLLVGIECKARVTLGTHQRERAHTELLSRFQGMSLSPSNTGTAVGGAPELYTIISALSTDFCAYIDSSHEAVQLLHQAYVCGFKYILLLVGDRTGNII